MPEGFNGVGRKDRRYMIRLWKESGTELGLKAWARQAQIGDIAHVWFNSKKGADREGSKRTGRS